VKTIILSLPLVLALWMLAVAAYLWLFHGQVPMKEVGSTAFAGTLGVFIGRIWQSRKVHG
jgi:hypothetical protein